MMAESTRLIFPHYFFQQFLLWGLFEKCPSNPSKNKDSSVWLFSEYLEFMITEWKKNN